MTDQPKPTTDQAQPMTDPPQTEAPLPPPPIEVPPPPPVKQPSKARTYIGIAVLVAILGVVLYAVRNNQDAGDLAVGTCFDVPSAQDFSTVEKHDCTEAHDAEVVFAGEMTGDSFPITLTMDNFIEDKCIPAAEAYLKMDAQDITLYELGYFSPTRDAWSDGERTVTCYLYDINDAKLTKSVKAS